ncbi:single-stranded DNA-binding protein [Olsenella uli]|uniref:single-stranded DNA-binding protein n=1 Tax=Olsenella uli TaxID=133926 RepID=UPI003D7A2921
MGFGINRVVVSGRLCKDPELRATRSGLDVMTVRLATEDRKKGADGAWVDDTSYLNVVSFGGVAAAAAQQLSKGSRVVFGGKVRQRSWEDEAGTRHYRVEIVADDIVVCGERATATAAPAQPSRPPVAAAPVAVAPPVAPADVYDEDIPF